MSRRFRNFLGMTLYNNFINIRRLEDEDSQWIRQQQQLVVLLRRRDRSKQRRLDAVGNGIDAATSREPERRNPLCLDALRR
jgi:hypothetical protein